VTGLVRVAVCTNRLPDEAAESLAALRSQVPSGALALVTSGLSDTEVAAHRSAFEETVLAEPREGLSRARNRALAWCEADDVLAFVDDDAIAADDWYVALARRWDEAAPEVACIGGPIRPRWPGEPPSWLSPPILPALTLLDYGSEPRDLDPAITNVYGANISFRVGPLREAGGFDPGFGHSGRRVFFSEEDEAQRALAKLGYRTRYVPDAAVWHVIPEERLTRGSFVRRRFAYGRSLGVRRARTKALALRQMLSSGAGALVAAAQRRDALFMERAVRAAENAGVLYGSTSPRRMA
jgi:GT2 family glycosyltransferase